MKTLPAVLSLAALSTLLVPSAGATLLAEEAFDYGPGFLQNRVGGTGFGGAWAGRPNFNGEDAQIRFPSDATLGYPGLTRTPGAATMSRADFRANNRNLDTSAGGAFDGYLDANGNIGADGTSLWVGFIATDDGAATNGGNARLRFNRDVPASQARPAGNGADTAFELVASDLASGVTRYVVANVAFAAGGDSLTIYTDPDLSGQPIGGTTTTGLDLAFDNLEIYGAYFSNPAPGATWDEIRVGTSQTDLGFAAVPEPASLALLAFGGMLVMGRRRTD